MTTDYKNFYIKEGRHYPKGFHFKLTSNNIVTCSAFFDENCLYQIEGENASDTNKLFGFSSAIHHHIQSARIAWRCMDGENIELLTYCYVDGDIQFDYMHTLDVIKPRQIFDASITDRNRDYLFRYKRDDVEVEYIIPKNCNRINQHYLLYPYFGGNEVAPHDMNIYLQY